MLEPDPKVVRELLTRYASLRIAQAERERPATARELADVSYTLCVMMATTTIHEAVAKADALLLAKETDAGHGSRGASGRGERPVAGRLRQPYPGPAPGAGPRTPGRPPGRAYACGAVAADLPRKAAR